MKPEQEYIDSIKSIIEEISYWQNNYDNYKGKHSMRGRRETCQEKIQFFTEQKQKLHKEFANFLKKDLDISK
jgi:hypothetical protein